VVERYKPQAKAKAKAAPSPKAAQPKVGLYFKRSPRLFIPTGCTLLDCVIGGGGDVPGGWPLGRVANIVGDKSVGKTLLAIEAMANFARSYPNGQIWYREAEAAFDVSYALELGLPVGRVDFGKDGEDTEWNTIEEVFEDLDKCLAQAKRTGQPGLYIIDSLDALSSEKELVRDIRKGTYGMDKQKLLSELFRVYSKRIKQAQICVIFISQIRDKIDATFGKKYERTGGKSLDFYASAVVYLSYIEQVSRKIGEVRRAIGVVIKAKCEKNKIALPFRDCTFAIRFGYGIDDEAACVSWLEGVKRLEDAGLMVPCEVCGGTGKRGSSQCGSCKGQRVVKQRIGQIDREKLTLDVRRIWREVEADFAPERRKYA
jgi:recombination protein RecA